MDSDVCVLIASAQGSAQVFDLAVHEGVALVLDSRRDAADHSHLKRLLDRCYLRTDEHHLAEDLLKVARTLNAAPISMLVLTDPGRETQTETLVKAINAITTRTEIL